MSSFMTGVFSISPLIVGLVFMSFGAWLKTLYSTRQLLQVVGTLIATPIFITYWILTKEFIPPLIITIFLIIGIKNFIKDKNIERQIIFAINEQTNKFNNYEISISEHLSHIKDETKRIQNITSLLSNKGLISSSVIVSE